jgi:hypothetical protein
MRFVCGSLLTDNAETYQPTPLFAEIQRDAGHDDCPTGADGKPQCGRPLNDLTNAPPIGASDAIVNAIEGWRTSKAAGLANKSTATTEVPVLMLSGGGLWGSYGAGFLKKPPRRDWAVVTGISTGALQGLFVAAGDYDGLAAAYAPKGDEDFATKNSVLGLLRKGSQYDLAPLRGRVLAYLLPPGGAASPLLKMIEPGRPNLSIAMVEARSGDLKVVHVTQLIRAALNGRPSPDQGLLRRVAECVAGVAIASSSIPVRLTPVQIDGHTYMDGGVRMSVFDAGIGRRMAYAAGRAPTVAPHLYVVRNGPTVVFRDADAKNRPGVAAVDARPDAYSVGMRGYSTIVNESELMSVASLRLRYQSGKIDVTTADGFNAPGNRGRCGPRPDEPFNRPFMLCLIEWGQAKAATGKGWISLSKLPSVP